MVGLYCENMYNFNIHFRLFYGIMVYVLNYPHTNEDYQNILLIFNPIKKLALKGANFLSAFLV